LADTALVAIDDGNYAYKFQNTAYVNMVRKKLGLGPVPEPAGNIGKPFWQEAEALLKTKFKSVEYLPDTYKKDYPTDIFWSYFKSDREILSGMAMEKTEDLAHRFDIWRVKR